MKIGEKQPHIESDETDMELCSICDNGGIKYGRNSTIEFSNSEDEDFYYIVFNKKNGYVIYESETVSEEEQNSNEKTDDGAL